MREIETVNQVWETLRNINLNEEKINIFCNPKAFFDKFLNRITDDTLRKTIRSEIYIILRDVSDLTDNADDDLKISNRCKSDLEFVKVCRQFYEYTLNTLIYLMREHTDTILDAYNEQKISKDCMENYLTVFKRAEKNLLAEKNQLELRIREYDVMLNRKDMPDFLDEPDDF